MFLCGSDDRGVFVPTKKVLYLAPELKRQVGLPDLKDEALIWGSDNLHIPDILTNGVVLQG